MRPVNHMNSSEDEIIAHIKDSLATFEEPYTPGAWENFSKLEHKKTGLILWIGRLSSAAAIVIIGIALFWFTKDTPVKISSDLQKEDSQNVAGLNPVLPSVSEEISSFRSSNLPEVSPVKKEVPAKDIQEGTAQNSESDLVASFPISEELKETPLQLDNRALVAAEVSAQQPRQPQEIKSVSFEEFLRDEANKVGSSDKVAKVAVKDNKWAMGVVVSPSFGNAGKLNMGYGVSMGYSLSDKVSLNSGISYNEMAASRSVGQPQEMSSPSLSGIAGESKSLESVEQRVTGFDIPLDIKYNLSKSIYANIGVSAFAVIDQQRSNNYIQERLVSRSDAIIAGGNEFKTVVVSEKVSESAPKSAVENNNYIGFYNFSFGYKQKIAKDKSISIEPFMKVPMKEVSKDNLRLMGTGVKLKFDF